MARNSTPLLKMFTYTAGCLSVGELTTIFASRAGATEMQRTSMITLFSALSLVEQTTLFDDMSEYLNLGDIAWLLTENCLDPSISDMPRDIWGSDAQIEALQYIRGCVTNDTFDSVDAADDMVNVDVSGTHLFNVIVAMYRKWNRLWKRANPEHSPEPSYAFPRVPRPHPPVHQRHSASPGPRQSPWTHNPSGLSPSPRPPSGGAYRDSASVASVSPPPHARPSTSHGHQSRPASRSRTPPGGYSAPRHGSARSHMDAALLNLKALQL